MDIIKDMDADQQEIVKVSPDGKVEVFLHEPEHVARIALLAHQYYTAAETYRILFNKMDEHFSNGGTWEQIKAMVKEEQ